MSDPTEAAVAAWQARLRGAGLRAYDEVPEKPVYPYFAVSTVQPIPDEDACSRGSEVYLTFNGWGDRAAVSSIAPSASTARDALRADLALQGHLVVLQELTDVLYTKDPATGHAQAAMTLRLLTEPA